MGIFSKIIRNNNRISKIGFWAGDGNNFQFLDPIIESLSDFGEFESVKYFYDGNEKKLKKEIGAIDVAWFEWLNGPVIPASKINRSFRKPLIVRLHRYEAYTDAPKQVDWSGVSLLIFISEAVADTFFRLNPDLSGKIKYKIIKNGIDLSKYKFNEKRKRTKNIAYIGRFHYHKNPSLLLQCFTALVKKDPSFKLYAIGSFKDPVIEEYFWYQIKTLGIKNKVFYEGFIKDVADWLQDKDYFLQPSLIEGQSVAALEAMACGLKPILHNYYHSYKVFPKKYFFNTVDECVDMILSDDFNRAEYRNYVEKENNFEKSISLIKKEIIQLYEKN